MSNKDNKKNLEINDTENENQINSYDDDGDQLNISIDEKEFKPYVFKQKEVKRQYQKTNIPTKIFALGGLEEVGKNTYCIEYDNELIMIDAGVKFPESTMLGVSAVIPDYSYLVENQKKIKALFITHGHEDHIGGIQYLVQQVKIPVIYTPKLAAMLIRDRLKEYKIEDKTIVKEYDADDVWKTKNFKVSYAALNHSIPDAFGILVQTPNGNIFSTGDYKFDWSPLGHFAELTKLASMGENGVELLMADSTNSEVEGYTQGEKSIISNIDKLFYKLKEESF